MNAIAANTTTVPARVAAPFPSAEKARLARNTTGMAAIVGNQESCQAGMRRNANARISNATKVAPAVNPDSILWACECHGVVVAGDVDPSAVETEDPVEERAGSRRDQSRGAEAAESTGPERAPETDAEHDHEQPGQIGSELVVEPRAARR